MFHHVGLMITMVGETETDLSRVPDPRSTASALAAQQDRCRFQPVVIQQVLHQDGSYHVVHMEPVHMMHWVETRPEVSATNFYDAPLFRELGKPVAEEIIVEPATVQQLLDQIRHMQAPEQAAIRARQRSQERREPSQVHASIISLAA